METKQSIQKQARETTLTRREPSGEVDFIGAYYTHHDALARAGNLTEMTGVDTDIRRTSGPNGRWVQRTTARGSDGYRYEIESPMK